MADNSVQNVVLDSITEGVFAVDSDWRITLYNKAAEKITGVSRDEAIGQYCRDVLRADVCESDCALGRTISTGEPVINKAVHIVDSSGNRKAVTISTALLRDESGEVIGGVETFRDMTEIEQLRKEIEKQYSFEDIISRNHKMQELFGILPQVARSDCTVLIEGETGTGKELVARAVHNVSGRKDGPFVAINCGALPDSLLESELFGYKAGAFTDAKRDKPGRFKLAEGGTVFLDEIGDVCPAMQVKLLRVLQERTYEPVGAVESERADIRVIAATNRNLGEMVERGEFRSDLYYRVNVVRLELPVLRERSEDVPVLVDHFIARFNNTYERNITGLSNEAMAALLRYDFPGNIRELENIIEHSFVLCQGDVIELRHLPGVIRQQGEAGDGQASGGTLAQMERAMIERALAANDGNRTAAARQLGIDPSTLFRKLKRIGKGV